MGKRKLIFAVLPVVVLLGAVVGWAYWTTTGSGSASASNGTLTAPGEPTRTGSGPTVILSWTAATVSGGGTISYHVERTTDPVTTWSDACGTTAASGTMSTSCTDAPSAGTYRYRVTASYRTWTAVSPVSDAFVVSSSDTTPPAVSSINRADGNPTNAGTVHWTVTFSESVSGVDAGDFTLARSGVTGGSITSVSPASGSTYTVTATTGTGDGTLGLNLVDDDSITDGAGNKLGGTGTSGAGNGSFTGQVYTIDKTAPTVSSINRAGAGSTVNAGPLSWTVSFSERVNNVATGNFTLVTSNTGGTSPSISFATATGGAPSATWTVTATTSGTTGQNNGSIGLNLTSAGTIADGATNGLATTSFTGQAYTYDTTAPVVAITQVNGAVRTFPYATTANITSLAGTCGSASSDLATVALTVDGSATNPASATCSSGNWTLSLSTAISAEAGHSVVASQSDQATNAGADTKTVVVDRTPPTNALSLANQSLQAGPAGTANAMSFLSGSTLWYDGATSGSAKLQNALTDTLSGPASSTFSALGGTASGWTFTGSTVSAPSGGPYLSNLLSWASATTSQPTEGVTGADAAGNTSTATSLTFKSDSTAPTDAITFPATNGNYTNATWDASPCSTGAICGTTTDTPNAAAFGSEAHTANASGGATTLALTVPASVATDDVLMADVTVSGGNGTTITAPSGWTQIQRTNQSTNIGLASYYHVVTNGGSEPASYSWTLSSGTRASGGISRYVGVDTSSPIDASSSNNGNNSASAAASAIITNSANDQVVGLFSINVNTSFTPASGMTERYDVTNTNSAGPTTEAADVVQATAGSTATKTATAGTSGAWAAQLIALKPAPSNSSGLAKVQVSVQATSGVSSGLYWDPSANAGLGGFASLTEIPLLASGTTSWSLAFPSSNFTDAKYTVKAYAVDNVGNYTTTPASSTNVTIDNVAPSTTDNTASIGSAWRNTSATVTLTPTDSGGSGVATTYYTTDGSTPTTSSTQGTSISLTNTGVYTIKYFSVDNAGNREAVKTASTQIRIDKVLPTNSLSLGTATGAFLSGSTLFYKSNAAGSFTLVNAVTDADSGPASTTFPAIGTTGWTHNVETVTGSSPYTSSAYSWTASPNNPPATSITSKDVAGNTSANSTISFTSDTTGPTGGALTVNGTAASAFGTTSANTSGSYSITVLTQYNADTGSGLASSSLVREETALNADGTGTCSTAWTNATTISGAAPISQTPATGTCYRYTLTGTDRVGNTSSISTIVKVDTTAPTTPALSITTSGSFAFANGTTAYYNGNTGTSSGFTVSAATSDPESGIQKVNFPALTSFTGGGDRTSIPYSATYTWTTSADSGTKTVTATNGIGGTASSSFSLVNDVAAPAGGALSVNGVTATGGGSTSTASTTSFSIGTRTDYAEAQSATQAGLASSILTVQSEQISGGTCGAPGSGGPFTSPTTISGTTQPSGIVAGFCYLYTLTGNDNVGNANTVKTTVAVNDAFQVSDPGTRTEGTAFNVTVTAVFNGATDTSYSGSKTITFTGPGTAPDGTAPTYPANVTFSSGVGTANITLFKAETTTLTATQGTITGTSASFTVNTGSALKLAWTSITTTSPGTPTPNPCYFSCTYSGGFGNNNTWTANVSITDTVGNIVSGVGSGHNVTVTLGGSKNGTINGGTANVTLTIPSSGAATSTTQLAYLAGSGNGWTDTLSGASAGFVSASASFSK